MTTTQQQAHLALSNHAIMTAAFTLRAQLEEDFEYKNNYYGWVERLIETVNDGTPQSIIAAVSTSVKEQLEMVEGAVQTITV